jgi:hypothetical protein
MRPARQQRALPQWARTMPEITSEFSSSQGASEAAHTATAKPRKWRKRRTLVFLISAALLLWAALIVAWAWLT